MGIDGTRKIPIGGEDLVGVEPANASDTTKERPEQVPETWRKAMERARSKVLRPVRIKDDEYIVPSISGALGSFHTVKTLGGKIVFCDCRGWRSTKKPCMHGGAVALLLLQERGMTELVEALA